MKTLEIQIPQGHEIDRDNSTFEKIVFKEIEVQSKYPKSVEEVKGRDWFIKSECEVQKAYISNDKNNLSSEGRAEAFLALMQLVELRDAYNEIDGGKEFEYGKDNYLLFVYKCKIIKSTDTTGFYSVLHFRKESTRDLFYERFKDKIETAKELL